MIKSVIAIVTVLFLFVGCGTKKQYFEPEITAGDISYDGKLPSKIVEVTRYGATLENGQIITSKGLTSVKIPKDYNLLGEFDDKLLITSVCGILRVLDFSGKVIYENKFPRTIASASLKEDKLAVVDAGNILRLVDIKSGKVLFENKQDDVYALDSRIAAPYFLSGLVLYPTLDGKIVIVDKNSGKVIRDVVVSSERFFNNVIFLDVIGDRLIAATAKRIISVNPNKTAFLNADVKDVIFLENRVFVFTKDGKILLTDLDLKVLKEKKFLFATFAGVIHGEFIYAVEKNGYLIATDFDLITQNVYELPSKIDAKSFTSGDTLYFDDRYFKLNKIR